MAMVGSHCVPEVGVGWHHQGPRGAVPRPDRPAADTCASSLNGTLTQDPEMQCLLLADGKSAICPSHVVVLPGDSGSSMAAISFTGALRIPVSTCGVLAKEAAAAEPTGQRSPRVSGARRPRRGSFGAAWLRCSVCGCCFRVLGSVAPRGSQGSPRQGSLRSSCGCLGLHPATPSLPGPSQPWALAFPLRA